MKGSLKKISISGFKSIRELNEFELKNLNVIIGANGAGKSNFIQFLKIIMHMARKNFQMFIKRFYVSMKNKWVLLVMIHGVLRHMMNSY